MSRVRLNTENRATQMAMVSPNKFHGAVEGCFEKEEQRKRNLWRIDSLHGQQYLMIVSRERPALDRIREQFGYCDDADEIKNYDVLLNSIEESSVWHFRLTANPTHSVKQEGTTRGKVTAHVSERYEMEWLEQKARQNGFSVLTEGSCVAGSDWKIFRKEGRGPRVRLKEVIYEGILRVEDVDLFRNALVNGIGRGKAYGMGMITIMRI